MGPLSQQQKKLARHALGLDNPDARGKSYRNRYTAGRGSPESDAWADMLMHGHAALIRTDDKQFAHYCLTRSGAEAALNKGERLCPEDFPIE